MYHNEQYQTKFKLFKERVPWQNMPSRTIITNLPDQELPNNEIHTSKYTFITFIPQNLIEQFSKMANIYFLVTGILQCVTLVSITNGVPVILGPLFIVVSISMLKDFIEDYKRHKSDDQENNREALLLTQNGWETKRWADILVGDLVKVFQDQYFPADMTILVTSEKKGVCFVETKNLDGETNLKNKQNHMGLNGLKDQLEELHKTELQMTYEKPNPFLYKFLGQIEKDNVKLPLDQNNFVLRGCSLRNSKWCIGLVAYNGHDTKIMLNSVKARPKKSALELLMNKFIVLIFAIQMIMCFFTGVYAAIWFQLHKSSIPYLQIDPNGIDFNFYLCLLVKWGNWVLIFTNFVPISLLVTLEMVKYFQGIAITLDKSTISGDGIVCSVQSSNLNEELGQVSYMFSDKTGTLTKNIMNFKCFTVGGRSYGDGNAINFTADDITQLEQDVTNVDFHDRRLLDDINNQKDEQSNHLKEYLLCLAVCHTLVADEEDKKLVYNASSPDELALVNLARYCGWKFMGIDENNFMKVLVKTTQVEYRFKLLHILEFTSARKRMSIVLLDDQGQYILYTKGADSIIEKRLIKSTNDKILEQTWQHLEEFASTGLRTLLLAKRVIQTDVYLQWEVSYAAACASIEGRDEAMEQLQDEIETDLELLGGTAIEDQLQDNVRQTIQSLKDAGIIIWVLTGDKIETAINIGYSCQLLSESQENLQINGCDEETVTSQLQNASDKLLTRSTDQKDYALIVSGDALIVISNSPTMKTKLTVIAQQCKAVVACRVSPKQKQEIVTLVRQANPNVTTMAIGDGANDVNMITAAHVGIGIRGVEGQQAARASDYAIGEFQIVQRLLLIHGRESYRKNSRLVLYNFFKNMMLVLPQFWYGFYNGFSAVSLYDAFMYQCYNLFFASLPIVLYAIFDQEHAPEALMKDPKHYQLGLRNALFNYKVYIYWIGSGAFQAMIIGLVTYPILESASISSHGRMGSFFATGTSILGYAVYNANLKILLFSHTYTIASLTALILSITAFIMVYFIEARFVPTVDNYNTFSWSFGVRTFYLASFVLQGSTYLLDLFLTRWDTFSSYNPTTKKEEGITYNKEQVPHIELVDQTKISSNREVETDEVHALPSNRTLKPTLTRRYTGYAYSQEEPQESSLPRKSTYQTIINNQLVAVRKQTQI